MLFIPTYALSRNVIPQVEISEGVKAVAYIVGVPVLGGLILGGLFGVGSVGAAVGFGLGAGAIFCMTQRFN